MLDVHGSSSPDRPTMSSTELSVSWYPEWNAEMEDALTALPELRDCSHELYRRLARNSIRSPKRYARVMAGDSPVAAIALRRYQRHWEPVTMWLLPGVLFPAVRGYEVRSLAALKEPVDVFWWRMAGPPPQDPSIRDMRAIPVYGMSLGEDYEQFWRESGLWKNVRHNRNRCKEFGFSVDEKGSAEWVIRKWAEKWSDENPHILDHVEDRILVANYLTERGRYHTVLLRDGQTTVAGASVFVHGRDLVASVNYRDTEYDRYGVMSRVNDYIFTWGAEAGYAFIDIGGGPEYKQKWAPVSGQRHYFSVCPPMRYALRWLQQRSMRLRQTVMERMGA